PRNEGMLATWTMSTVPRRAAGSIMVRTRWSAIIGATSEPWVPAINASVGPDCAPRTMVIGMRVAVSTPAGTSMNPDVACPGRAVAEPIVRDVGCWSVAIRRAGMTVTMASPRERDGMILSRYGA